MKQWVSQSSIQMQSSLKIDQELRLYLINLFQTLKSK
jgi:hypothetical protein